MLYYLHRPTQRIGAHCYETREGRLIVFTAAGMEEWDASDCVVFEEPAI